MSHTTPQADPAQAATSVTPDLARLQAVRRQALRQLKTERSFDAIVVFSQGGALGAAARSHAYLRLFIDWDGVDQSSMLVLAAGRSVLFVTNPFQIAPAAAVPGVDEVVFARPAEVGPQLAKLFTALGLPAAPSLGLCGLPEMPVQTWQSINAALPGLSHADCSAELDAWRVHKQQAEIDGLDRAAGICDHLFERLGGLLHEDRAAWQVQRDIEHAAFMAGAEYCKTWLTIAPWADGPRYLKRENLRAPRAGDQVLLGLMLKLDGYWGHAIRMGSWREAQPEHRQAHDVVLRMFEAALPHCRIGGDLRQAEADINAVLDQHLGTVPRADLSRFRNGHGLGLAYEEPLSVSAFPQHADPGAAPPPRSLAVTAEGVFELHPNFFIRGVGGAALGDMIHASGQPARRMLVSDLGYRIWR
ncbi:M24 family metallopeptidase [Ottowia sp.]|uniref:M24 family metallopeptidase n=1 Tax=Ottowia sp. TaxID=1898956 RepID=UPI0039E2D7D0